MKKSLFQGVALAVLFIAGSGAAAVTGTVVDPEQNGLAGVSIYEPGCPGDAVISGADGSFVHPFGCGVGVERPVNGRLLLSENTRVEIFDIRGNRVDAFVLKAGAERVFAGKGVFAVKVVGENIDASFKYVNMGLPLILTSAKGGGLPLARQNAVHAPKSMAMTKDGYAIKTFQLEDGQDYTLNFGLPIGRAFDPAAYDARPGFNLEIAEEFDAAIPGDKSDAVWRASDGTWNDNACRFIPSYVSFSGGSMVLKMDNAAAAGGPSETEGENYNSGTYNAPAKDFSCAEWRTKNQGYRFGYYEVAIDPPDLDEANGFLATMFTYHVPAQEFWREVDVEITGNNPSGLLTNVFQNSGTTAWQSEAGSGNTVNMPGGVSNRVRNVYAFEWLPDGITWYINGEEVRHFIDETEAPRVAISWLNHKIIMNFWISPYVGGSYAANAWPIYIKYDYFRFYRWDQDADYELVGCRSPTHWGCN